MTDEASREAPERLFLDEEQRTEFGRFGFMCWTSNVNATRGVTDRAVEYVRADLRSDLAAVVPDSEYSWVIECAKSDPSAPLYWQGLCTSEGINWWTRDYGEAVHFCRERDAGMCTKYIETPIRVCEHALDRQCASAPKPPANGLEHCPHSDGNSCEQYRLQGQHCQDCPANAGDEIARLRADLAASREKFTMHTAAVHAWFSALLQEMGIAGVGDVVDVQSACSKAMDKVEQLRSALERSVALQAHYASILNNYDGGERIEFKSADEWLNRLAALASPKPAETGE